MTSDIDHRTIGSDSPKTLAIIQGEPVVLQPDGSIVYNGPMMVDGDGSGPSHGDPDYQRDTSLHLDGQPLNADVDQYIVVPPQIINAVSAIVLGCRATVYHQRSGLRANCVVGDIGPHHKLGEASIATCRALDIPSSPTSGGESSHILTYTIYPGQAAVVNGKRYNLQPRRA